MSNKILSSYHLQHWSYHNSDEVFLLYSDGLSVIPIFIHRSDFDRAFGAIVPLDLFTLIEDFSYRYFGSDYLTPGNPSPLYKFI